MDRWLHCNQCHINFSNKSPSFVVTTCAHIFCCKCEHQATKPVCGVCGRKCGCTPLNDKIDANAAAFFKPPSEMRKKGLDLLKKADEIQRFQDNQLKMKLKAEALKTEQQSKLLYGAMQSVEQLKKENGDMKRILIRNKANICVSPGKQFLMSSPERSPITSPSSSPRRKSPTTNQKYKQVSLHYSSMPCSPNKAVMDSHQHAVNKQYNKSPTDRPKRISMRSPPVDGKLYVQSPPSVSPSRGHPYKTSEGIISKQATIAPASPQMPSFMSYQSPKKCGFTPPTTPSFPQQRGYSSCPATPDNNRMASFYARMQARKQ